MVEWQVSSEHWPIKTIVNNNVCYTLTNTDHTHPYDEEKNEWCTWEFSVESWVIVVMAKRDCTNSKATSLCQSVTDCIWIYIIDKKKFIILCYHGCCWTAPVCPVWRQAMKNSEKFKCKRPQSVKRKQCENEGNTSGNLRLYLSVVLFLCHSARQRGERSAILSLCH